MISHYKEKCQQFFQIFFEKKQLFFKKTKNAPQLCRVFTKRLQKEDETLKIIENRMKKNINRKTKKRVYKTLFLLSCIANGR